MAKKPTYKELEQRVKELEKEAVHRKRAEEDLKLRREILENMVEGVNLSDEKGIILFTNPNFDNMFGYNRGELIGKRVSVLNNLSPEENARFVAEVIKQLKTKGSWFGEASNIKKDGTPLTTYVRVSALEVSGKLYLVSVQENITEHKRAEEQIKRSLEEKELLLREIHHRVKNNMQTITSLLRIQAAQIKEKKYTDMFQDSLDRVQSMSLIHEKLYQSKDLTSVDFNGYVKTLVSFLFRSHGVDTNKIAPRIEVEDASLSIETAIPCGLLINELITNSLKYAFPEERKGELKISLRSIGEDDLELIVSDDGIGMPEDLDIEKTESFGIDLVRLLADQLDGHIELDRTGGTKFHILFKRQIYKPRI